MFNRAGLFLLLLSGLVIGLTGPVLSQQTDEAQTLKLDLDKFPDQQPQNKDLSLDLEKFPNRDNELDLNLEQFPDQPLERKDKDLNLDLKQFEKEGEPAKPIRETTRVQTTGTNGTTISDEKSGFYIFLGLSFLMLVIFLWRKRGKRKSISPI